MGTEVHYSMRDVNEDSNVSGWPLFYGDKQQPMTNNGHYYNGFIPRTIADAYPGCDKDAVKQQMVQHEAIFKNQVYELHRLYRRQRDMMEEFKRKEYHKYHISIDASSSSSLLPSQKPYEDGHKWQIPSFPLTNSSSARPSIFGADISNSPLSCSKGNNNNNNNNNNSGSKDCETAECRPSKVRKKLFDLELLPDENVDNEDQEEIDYKNPSSYKDISPGKCFRGSNGLADLNEPVHIEEPLAHGLSAKPIGAPFFGPTHERFEKPISRPASGPFNPLVLEGKSNGRDWLSNTRETGNSRSHMNFSPGTHMPFPSSRTSNSYPYMNSTDSGNYWGKPNGGLTHKLTSFQKPSFLSSPQNHAMLGDKWRMNGCYTPNGFHHGSSSGSKDPCTRLPFNGFDQQKIFKGSNFIDLTETTKGIDLNNENNSTRKCEKTELPWLQAKPTIFCKNESLANNGKIPGIPIFGNSCVSKNESSSLVSTSASLCFRENGKIKTEMENRGFDINVAWDDSENKQIDAEDFNLEKIKNNFDLNSCLTEDEDIIVPEKLRKITMEIDLEAPFIPEIEEEKEEEEAVNEIKEIDDFDNDESLAKVAAEAIVVMSAMTGISSQQDQAGSTCDVAVPSDNNERLLLLVDVIENAGFVSMDEFEELTLKLELTKKEDYMPTPSAPENFQEPNETGPSAGPTRPRRGQARRGRPRRDFQRDILPGLVSLSRHEVTEDLQVFGGLMRATGHSWNVGPTRRNGTRGRRKSVSKAAEPHPVAAPPPPPPPPPPLPLSERSLTGWGKTTRRPRRQRCAAGSSAVVPLT